MFINNIEQGVVGKIVGGIYDDRLLVKPIKDSKALLTNPTDEIPYEEQKK